MLTREEILSVDPECGLTSEEASERLKTYGKNELIEKKGKSIFAMAFEQLKDHLVIVLIIAAIITFLIGHGTDGIIILIVVAINAAIGVFQEHKADQAVAALKKMSSPKALVRRDGKSIEIDSKHIVPGDVLILDAGRFVLADLRLIETHSLQIEESSLTGESVPTEKDASAVLDDNVPLGDKVNMAFMSTMVTYGRGIGVVVATGMNTEIGKIAQMISDEEDSETPLQKKLSKLGQMLGYLAMGVCALVMVIGIFQKREIFDLFLTAISLAVAAIPEGLAAIIAIVLALGVTRLTKKNAIVKKLPAVETLGSVNIVCSDKTGTLTLNQMTVQEVFTQNGTEEEKIMLSAALALCSDATFENGEATGDPTEVAFIKLAIKENIGLERIKAEQPRVSEYPFESDRKLMSVLNSNPKSPGGYTVYTKGAIDNLITKCTHIQSGDAVIPITEEHRLRFLKRAEEYSRDALRVLAGAYKNTDRVLKPSEMESDLIFVGLVGMIDPPRDEVKASVALAKKAGITTVMITGDHIITAFAIAKKLGIAESMEQAAAGSEIDSMSDDELARFVRNIRIFARVSPEHKVRIVKAYNSNDNIVSMTGDGVNDAPALKAADIGVAMGITGTDVSKSAADMILTDDNFTTIITAVEEGRGIYENIKKAVYFLLSCNLGEVVTILFAMIFSWPLPLVATQILWINLITDTIPAIALGIDPTEKGVMNRPPRKGDSFFSGGVIWSILLGGVLIGGLTLFGFYYGLVAKGYTLGSPNIPEDVMAHGRTIAFITLASSQLFYSLSKRSDTESIFRLGLGTNKALTFGVIAGIFLQLIVLYIPLLADMFKVQPLSIPNWLLVVLLSTTPLFATEVYKFFKRRMAAK